MVSLGLRSLRTGQGAVTFDPFTFNVRRAYSFLGLIQLTNPTNVFSFLRIHAIIINDNGSETQLLPHTDIQIEQKSFYILVPFSPLYGNNGNAALKAERIAIVPETGETESNLTLSFNYEPQDSIRSWFS